MLLDLCYFVFLDLCYFMPLELCYLCFQAYAIYVFGLMLFISETCVIYVLEYYILD